MSYIGRSLLICFSYLTQVRVEYLLVEINPSDSSTTPLPKYYHAVHPQNVDSQQGVHYIDNKDSLLSNPYLNKKYKRPGKQWKNKLERHEEQDWKENSQLLDKPRWQSKGWNGWKSKNCSSMLTCIRFLILNLFNLYIITS